MPKLFEKLKEDHLKARKNRNTDIAGILSVVLGEATKNNKEPSDEEVLAIIKKVVKSLDEMVNKYGDESSRGELEALNAYLPEEVPIDEYVHVLHALTVNHGSDFITMKNMKAIKEIFLDEFETVNMSTLAQAIKDFNK